MRHLYVHVPFCARRCVYCDFAIAVRRDIPARAYVDAVLRERTLKREAGRWDDEPLVTLYLGGGTPSLLPARDVERLVDQLLERESADRTHADFEVTIEANPDDVTARAARLWVAAGVTRVSLGVQSFDPDVLRWMHRTHTAEQSERAAGILREAGIVSLSVDLIFALPEGVGRGVERDLERAISLQPDHMSVYGLTVEARTPLGRWVERARVSPAPDDRYAAEFIDAHNALTAVGYHHYEVSNFAKEGHESRHNSVYWALEEPGESVRRYAGLGPSAHSFDGTARSWNVRDWAAYELTVARGGDPTQGSETIGGAEARLERLYLGLRTTRGIPAHELPRSSPVIARAETLGWLEYANGRGRLTPAGWLRLDEITAALTTSSQGG